MTIPQSVANEILAEVLEHFALELRFTLAEFEIHNAPEALAALYRGRELLISQGGESPFVVDEVLRSYVSSRH
jgi:hypothetical protein